MEHHSDRFEDCVNEQFLIIVVFDLLRCAIVRSRMRFLTVGNLDVIPGLSQARLEGMKPSIRRK